MYNEHKYDKVKDIYSVPCMTRINGEKAIRVWGNKALVQYADGYRWYSRRNSWSDWEKITEVICNNA